MKQREQRIKKKKKIINIRDHTLFIVLAPNKGKKGGGPSWPNYKDRAL